MPSMLATGAAASAADANSFAGGRFALMGLAPVGLAAYTLLGLASERARLALLCFCLGLMPSVVHAAIGEFKPPNGATRPRPSRPLPLPQSSSPSSPPSSSSS